MVISLENTGQVQIWSWLDDFWQSYAPLTLKEKEIFSSHSNNMKFSVSAHYLPNGITHSTQT
jgi:hypothetical protein